MKQTNKLIEEKVKEILNLVPNIACGNKSIDELKTSLNEVAEQVQENTLKGRLEGFKEIEITETVNVPQEMQEYFRKQGREAREKEIIACARSMGAKQYIAINEVLKNI